MLLRRCMATGLPWTVLGGGVESSDGSIGVVAPGEIVAVFVIGH